MSVAASLAEKAALFERTVEERLVDRHGLVLACVDARTMAVFAPGFFTPDKDMMRHPQARYADFGPYIAYENSGMCTGAYLSALTWRYRITRDRAALARARRTFEAISFLYEVSQEVEPGFFSKFHEGKVTDEMSTDQCLYAMAGLDLFLDFATASEATRIRQIIAGIASMWMRKEYKHPYRDRNFPWPWPPNRFPPFHWLAWRHTGEERFRREFLRLAALPETRKTPPFIPTTPETRAEFVAGLPEHERRRGRVPYGTVPEQAASAQLSLDPMLEYDAPDRDLWLRQLRVAHEMGAPMLAEDGLCRGHCEIDMATGKIAEVEKPSYSGGKPNPIWRHKGYICDVKSGHGAAMFARAAFTVDLYHPDLGAAARARQVLEQAELSRMVWQVDHRNQLPRDMEWMTHAFSGDALTHWLWAYWMARGRSQLQP